MDRLFDHWPDQDGSGIYHALGKMWFTEPTYPWNPDVDDIIYWDNFCTRYYDYFALDPQLIDTDRRFNPWIPTFGLCSRPWLVSLLIVSAFITAIALILFILLLFALILRFRKLYYAPIELEVRGTY
jgi:hypothetical protein